METPNLDTLKNFSLENMPDLDVTALGALELFSTTTLPDLAQIPFSRPLVIGSVNAHITGRILFEHKPAIFADENDYRLRMQSSDIDGAVLVSASGGKHSIEIANALRERQIETYLLTNNPEPEAGNALPADHILTFPKNREPYSYNTSTYLGMILAAGTEQAEEIHRFITEDLAVSIPQNLGGYNAFTLVVPPRLSLMRDMLKTKFDELFGPHVNGRVFTSEEIKHAKTIVHSASELFITFDTSVDEELYEGSVLLPFGLPQDAQHAALMAAGYYFIGCIQREHPPYFKESIEKYTETTSRIFGHKIEPIVE